MLNVHQLNVFITAAETLNFTQTAKKLHLTQSSVSQHIKSLENQLEMELFVRKGRTLEITDAGTVLLPLAREIVQGSMRAAEQMELLKEEVHGHLVVGCNTAPGKYVLPTLLARFHELHPMVKITCQVLPPDLTMKKMEEGEIHFAISNLDSDNHPAGDFKLYMRESIELIVHPEHPWAERGAIEPHELYEASFISRETSSGTYANVKRALTTEGIDIERLSTLMVMGTSEATALAVQQNLGVGFVSRMIVDKICNGYVRIVRIKGVDICQDIYFGRQIAQPASAAQAAFWDYVLREGASVLGPEYILN